MVKVISFSLWGDKPIYNTKTFISLMFKLYGGGYTLKMKEFVVIKD